MECDAAMALKEMLYSSGKMRWRLVVKFECSEVADETASYDVPAFLRRKASEGAGRKR